MHAQSCFTFGYRPNTVSPCSLIEIYRRFGGMSVNFYQTTRHHIPENNNLQVSCFKLSDRRIRRFSTVKTKAHDWLPSWASCIHLPSLPCISLLTFKCLFYNTSSTTILHIPKLCHLSICSTILVILVIRHIWTKVLPDYRKRRITVKSRNKFIKLYCTT
jgi:hypothetical protein